MSVDLGDEVLGPDETLSADGPVPVWELVAATETQARLVMRVWWASIAPAVEGSIPEPQALEDHDELRWLEPGQWRDVNWLPADERIVTALLEDAIARAKRAWC